MTGSTHDTAASPARGHSGAPPWAPLAITMAAAGFSLRPPITAMGAALGFVPESAEFDPTILGWVVTVPLWCYAVGGALTPRLAARWGAARTATAALAVMTAGQAVRVTGGAATLLAGTTVTALATAVLATLLPVLAARSGNRMSRLTAIYAPAIGIGSAAGAFATAPLSAASSWRWGLALWAPLCALALTFWLCARWQPDDAGADAYARTPAVVDTSAGAGARGGGGVLVLGGPGGRLAWAMALLFGAWAVGAFAVMSWLPSIYRDAGVEGTWAGVLLGLAAAAGIPVAVVLPGWVRRVRGGPARDMPILVVTALPAAGLLGLWWAPTVAPWLWAIGVGVGLGGLSLILTLIPLSAPGPRAATALSAVTHGVGYTVAGGGVALLSMLRVHLDDWATILWILLAACVIQAVAGATALRSGPPGIR